MNLIRLALAFTGIFLFTQTSKAQTMKKYDSLWKKVDELAVKKNLPKSALVEVNKIYALAKKEKQAAQVIKALLYQINLNDFDEEDATIKGILALEKEAATAVEPSRSILLNIAAERYWKYFQNNRWKFYNRTTTVDFRKEDIATWGAEDFHNKISTLYLSSIKEEKILKQTGLATFDALIIKGNVRKLRPTLYDLLAHRALAYFENDERNITKPAYAFQINEAKAFDRAADFANAKFTTKDSTSLQHKALLLYQNLIAFHILDKQPDALIDVDLKRLTFVKRVAVVANKEALYANALQYIANQYTTLPAVAQAWYLLASWHADKAASYQATQDTANQYEYVKAKEICDRVLLQKDSSEGKVNCTNLLKEILRGQLNHVTEKVNVPNQPFRTFVNYRNTPKLNARIIAINKDLSNQLQNRYDDKYWQELIQLPVLRKWSQALPDTKDYQTHATEIKVDALPVGEYALLLSGKEDFSLEKNPMSVQFFYVSNISYVNSDTDYFVLHRESGKPLVNTEVQVWNAKYDYSLRKQMYTKAEKLYADNKGYFKLKNDIKRNGSVYLELTHEKDHLFLNEQFYTYYRETDPEDKDAAKYEKENSRVYFFTDRSIYRPGQTVHFKGIALTKDFTTRKNKILSGMKGKVILYDANHEKVTELQLTTNEYGSYAGSFTLPEGIMNGQFSISESAFNNAEIYFSVEEYKRPKFFVEYEKLKGSYRVNDSIAITGLAQAYAGNNIDGATVSYRIVREPRFIYHWMFGRWGMPRASEMEIGNGTAVTDANGKFTVRFKAIPDETLNKALDPIFNYRIIADVTDINGETRSAETNVSVSYKAIQLQVSMPGKGSLSIDSLKHLFVSTNNMNGEFEPTKVNVQISRLKQPERLIRSRYWSQPDQFVMSKEEYIKLFPHDEYSDETNKSNWPKEVTLPTITALTTADTKFNLPITNLQAGWYALEISALDKYGELVKDIQYVLLTDEKAPTLPSKEYLIADIQKSKLEPGEKALITIGSAANDITVIEQIAKEWSEKEVVNSSEDFRLFTLNNEKKTIELAIADKDRGGRGTVHFFVKDNRVYISSQYIDVPWSNKMLNIQYETFRDKTLPGSEEQWKVHISGYNKDKIAAELLGSMYDASLDQFQPHAWTVPYIWQSNFPKNNWSTYQNFSSVSSQDRDGNDPSIQYVSKNYDQLKSFATLLPERMYSARKEMKRMDMVAAATNVAAPQEMLLESVAVTDSAKNEDASSKEAAVDNNMPAAQIRKNFNETAFFLPQLYTDSKGDISFSFTMPEALTKWKFQALAHTKDLAFGYSTMNLVTQKELMIQPNAPRFLREGDRMELTAKIVNLSSKELTGTIHLELLDANTLKPVDGIFQNMNANQYFTVEAGKSVPAKFTIEVPYRYNSALVYRFVAKSGNLSDGEEAALPVLTNSMLVTETMPLAVRGNQEKTFSFEKLLQSGNSETLQHYALTTEFTTNPAWYAVQALPYLKETKHESSDQLFNRYYANALASKIANASPKLKEVFEKWRTSDTAALLSNLQKNPELKAVLLQETPWVLDAKNEAQQKRNIALLFDMVNMEKELTGSLNKLTQMQSPNGGFVWFKGGPDDRYMTQYIITGIGRLIKLKAVTAANEGALNAIFKAGMRYLDNRIIEDFEKLAKKKIDPKVSYLGNMEIQYLYMRSFFPEYDIPGTLIKSISFYRKQSQQFWQQQSRYMQGMIALQLYRTGDKKTSGNILKSLKENAIINEEMGMYWKENKAGYYWYQAPVETQSLLIEAFSEIGNDSKVVGDLKTWLLKQKQTQNWKSSKATADACYALLLQGEDWLQDEPSVTLKLGSKTITSDKEAGTGYFKTTIESQNIKPEMGNISVKVNSTTNSNMPTWGAVYWQYFERLDKITPATTPLKLDKKLFVEKNSDRGPVLQPVTEGTVLKVGDKIKVRIELRVDRDMEYVHMKDMRASCLEPVNVLSNYKWQGGLGYYETTKDASTNFFFDWLAKGTYVFEYPLFVTASGNFSNGITSIQCLYAPEFSSHSEGVRVNVLQP